MFKNYLATAWRNLCRHPMFSAIKIAGLSVGLAFCLTILAFVSHEKSYDQHMADKDRIFAVITPQDQFGNKIARSISQQAYQAIRDNCHGLCEQLVQLSPYMAQLDHNQQMLQPMALRVEGPLFDLFDLKLAHGDPSTALSAPDSVILNHAFAEKHFPGENPLGKVLFRKNGTPMTVTGVLDKVTELTHLRYLNQYLLASSATGSASNSAVPTNSPTYLKTNTVLSEKQLNRQLNRFYVDSGLVSDTKTPLAAIPLVDLNLTSGAVYPKQDKMLNQPLILITLSILAAIILWLACANYTNLYIASLTLRNREIGIRRILGACRSQLLWQFLMETLVVTLSALVLGLALFELMLPWASHFLENEVPADFYSNSFFLTGLLLCLLATSLAAGLQPALIIARKKLLDTIAGTPAGKKKRGRLLVTVQFLVTTLLVSAIFSALTGIYQLSVEQTGYDDSNTISLRWPIEHSEQGKYNAFIAELNKLSNVVSVAEGINAGYISVALPNQAGKTTTLRGQKVGDNFLSHHRISLLSGEASPDNLKTLVAQKGIVLDEQNSAVLLTPSGLERLGLTSANATGQIVTTEGKAERRLHIVGLIPTLARSNVDGKEHDYISLDQASGIPADISIRYRAGVDRTLIKKQIAKLHSQIVSRTGPFYDIHKIRMEDDTSKIRMVVTLLSIIAIICLLLALLGQYAMSRFAVQRLYKNIAIQKVLGANSLAIAGKLVSRFTKPVMLASLLSAILYFLGAEIIRQFEPGFPAANLLIIASASIVMLLIAATAIWTTCLSAAKADPVKSLRTE